MSEPRSSNASDAPPAQTDAPPPRPPHPPGFGELLRFGLLLCAAALVLGLLAFGGWRAWVWFGP